MSLKLSIINIKNKDLIKLLLNCLNFIKIKIQNLNIINLIEIKSVCKNILYSVKLFKFIRQIKIIRITNLHINWILIGIININLEINKIFIILNKRKNFHVLFYQNSPFSGILFKLLNLKILDFIHELILIVK